MPTIHHGVIQSQKIADIQAIFGRLLDSDISRRVLRPGILSGLNVLVAAIKANAPVSKKTRRQKVGGPIIRPGRLGRSPGRSMKRERTVKQVIGKAGLNVGKKKFARGSNKGQQDRPISRNYAPHAHLVTLGTSLRTRNKKGIGGYFSWMERAGIATAKRRRTGSVSPNRFVRRAAASAGGSAVNVAKSETLLRLQQELSKGGSRIQAQIDFIYSL